MKPSLIGAASLLLLATACAHHKGTTAPSTVAAEQKAYPYHKPITSLGSKFGSLPDAVQNTVRSQVGIQEITDIYKGSTADRVYYKFSFKDVDNFPPLYVAADGSVLNPDLTVAVPAPHDASGGLASAPPESVTTKELPAAVLATFEQQASGAEPSSISKEAWGNHVVYIFTFKDEDNRPKLYVEADGTLLHHAEKALPGAASAPSAKP